MDSVLLSGIFFVQDSVMWIVVCEENEFRKLLSPEITLHAGYPLQRPSMAISLMKINKGVLTSASKP